MPNLNKGKSIWSWPYILMIAISLFDTLSYMMVVYVITQYSVDIGIKASVASVIVSAMIVSTFMMRPFGGRLLDRFNPKKVLTIAFGGLVVTMLLYFVAKSFVALLLVRILHGICYSITTLATVALVGEMLPVEKMGSGMAWYGIGLVTGITLGSVIGTNLYFGPAGSNGLFTATLISAAAAFVLCFFIPNKKKAPAAPVEKLPLGKQIAGMFCREALPAATCNFMFMFAQAAYGAYIMVFVNSMGAGVGDIGTFYLVWGLALYVARPLAGAIYDKLGLAKAMVFCMICFAAFLLVISFTTSPIMTYAAAILGSVGYGGAMPVMQAAANSCTTPERRGVANSTQLVLGDVGSFIGTLVAGGIVGIFSIDGVAVTSSYRAAFLLSLIPLAVLLAICITRWKQWGKKAN